jgi:multiple sugar transport system permease protein
LLCVLLLAGARSFAAEPVRLRFQYWGDIYSIPIFEGIVARFNAAHPGTEVVLQRVNGRYEQKLLVQVAGRNAPDVVCVEVTGFVPLAEKDVLLPLNDYVRNTPDFDLKGYFPEVVRRFTRNGKLYALPRDTSPTSVVYYNKRLFDEAHIPYPTNDWSWSPDPDRVRKTGMDPNKDFLTICRKLTRYGSDGRIAVWGFDGGWDQFVYGNGGRLVDNVDHPKRITMNDPRVVDAIQFRADLGGKYRVAPTSLELDTSNASTYDLFMQGRIALRASGIPDSTGFRTITDFDWDVVQFPKGPTGLRGWPTGGTGFGITRQCAHPDAAWEFIRYIGGTPGLTALARAGRSMPALKSVANSPAWLDDQLPRNKATVVNNATAQAVYSPFTTAWPQCLNDFNSELDRVWLGQQTARQAINTAMPVAQKHLDQFLNQPNYPKLPWPAAFGAVFALVAALVGLVAFQAKRELGPHPTRAQLRETRAGYLAIAPWIIGFLVFTAGPLAVSVVMAFCRWDLISPARWAGLDNFRQIFHDDPLFPASLWNTLVYTAFSVPLHIIGGLALALLLNTGLKGMRAFRTIYYLPAVTSAVAASVLWKWIFNPDYGLLNLAMQRLHLGGLMRWMHLVDPRTGGVMWLTDERLAKPALIIMSMWGIGGGMIIYLAGLQGIPRSLYEAAEMDGASALSRFRNVTLPMLTPTIFFSAVMGLIGSFQVFTQALVMTDGGPHNATLFYVLYLYRAAFVDLRMGYASALAWILFAIIMAVTVAQFRFSRWVYYEGGGR